MSTTQCKVANIVYTTSGSVRAIECTGIGFGIGFPHFRISRLTNTFKEQVAVGDVITVRYNGLTLKQTPKHASVVTDCSDLYWEKQRALFCTVHAINAFFQTQVVTCEEMLEFAAEAARHADYIIPYDYEQGNFSPTLISQFLLEKYGVNLRLVRLEKALFKNNTFFRFYVSLNKGHAVSVIKCEGTWFLIDSETGVMPITSVDDFFKGGKWKRSVWMTLKQDRPHYFIQKEQNVIYLDD